MCRSNKLLAIVFFMTAVAMQAQNHQPVLWDLSELNDNTLTKSWLDGKIMTAEKVLAEPFLAVTDKTYAFSGDKHNYESLALYAWPNPENPEGAWKERDGIPNPEYKNYDGERITVLSNRFVALGEAYYLTRDRRYADYMKEQLKVWFVNKRTRMNPNFTHGQFIPGLRNGLGFTGAISEAYFLNNILECIAIMEQQGDMDRKLNKKLRNWFSQLSVWLHTSALGNEMHDVKDNHAVMYDVLLYRIAMYTGDLETRQKIISEFPSLRLAKHIAADGSQPLELKRSKAMMYSIYNLQHIVDLCLMIHNDGIDYYSQNRQSIDAAFAFIQQHIDKPKSFPYEEIGDWNLYQRQFAKLKRQKSLLR